MRVGRGRRTVAAALAAALAAGSLLSQTVAASEPSAPQIAASETRATRGGHAPLAVGAFRPPSAIGPVRLPGAQEGREQAVLPAAGPPNIIVLLLDDVPYLDPQTPWQATPQIAATFLQHGVRFSNFHGETPLCCPGRAGFLTGLHTRHHGVNWNNAALLNPSMTIATALHDSGYRTFLVGKYLNLYDRIAPTVPAGWDGFHATDGSPLFYDYNIWNNGDPRPQHYGREANHYSTDVITRKARHEIKSSPADQPIFGWISLNMAHLPITPAPRDAHAPCHQLAPWKTASSMEKDVSDKPAYIQERSLAKAGFSLTRLCRGLMSVDRSFVSIRNALIAAGRWDNTLFIITSDNGMAYGEHRMGYEKRTPYTTQLPLLAHWPAGRGTQPRSVGARLQNIDLAPTLCAIAGCVLGPYPNGQSSPDGVSFASLLSGFGPGPIRDAVLSSYPEKKGKIPQWDAVTTTAFSPLASAGCATDTQAGCRWHYVRYASGEREMYDVSGGPCWAWSESMPGDPCELNNRAGDPALVELQAALDQRLAQLIAGTGP